MMPTDMLSRANIVQTRQHHMLILVAQKLLGVSFSLNNLSLSALR